MSKKQKEWSIRYLNAIQPVDVKWLAYPYIPMAKGWRFKNRRP